jgi:hypothetical protein
MALYSVNNGPGFASASTLVNISTAFASAGVGGLLAITAESTTLGVARANIYEIGVGPIGVPNTTDCNIVWDLSAITAAGTANGAGMVPVALDSADVAGRIVADANYTVNPTITANSSRWGIGLNQRGSYRWTVNPGGPGEIVVPATDEAGYLIRAQSTNFASTCFAELKWRE